LRVKVRGWDPLASPVQREYSPCLAVDPTPAAGNFQVPRQALQAVAKKNLLVLKGGLAENFLGTRLMETAFLLSIYYYHYPGLNSRTFSGNLPWRRVDRGRIKTYKK
jgi:hypothetical protein